MLQNQAFMFNCIKQAGWILLITSLWFIQGCLIPSLGKVVEGKVETTDVIPSPQPLPKLIEQMPIPVVPNHTPKDSLTGKADGQSLQGVVREDTGALKENAYKLGAMQAKPDDQAGLLKGSASKSDARLNLEDDPDAYDQELMIEWDRWRNRFLRAIQSGMQDTLNNSNDEYLRWDPRQQAMVSCFPLGTTAWFSCQVTPDRRIVKLKLVTSSGFPGYDQAVLEAIASLESSRILQYPRGSKRNIVTQVAGIKTADSSEYKYFKFGDVERQRIPGN